jgi:hypothetical protein
MIGMTSRLSSKTPRTKHLLGALRRRATLGALAGGALLGPQPLPARADATASVEGGIYFGYAFGAPKGFHWGVEMRTRVYDRGSDGWCGGRDNYAQGVFSLRAGTILRHPYVQLLGGFGYVHNVFDTSAQVGIGYQHGDDRKLRVPLLLDARGYLARAYVELDLSTFRSGAADLGVMLPPPNGFGQCAIGRPLRDDAGAQLSLVRASDETAEGPAEDELWRRRAVMEAESVPAFTLLAYDLARAGAPSHLIDEARSAADDEVIHAELSASCASHGPCVSLAPLAANLAERRTPLDGEALLVRLAVESWLDGCLGEAAAAEHAARESERLACPLKRTVQRLIAKDERRHAELAWSVLEWTMRVGGATVERSLEAVLDSPPASIDAVDPGPAERLGYLGRDEIAEVQRCTRLAARERLRAMA